MTMNELDQAAAEVAADEEAYLVYMVMSYVHQLRELRPNHVLVHAFEVALKSVQDRPEQLKLL